MTDRIVIHEYEDRDWPFTDEDLDLLVGPLGRRFTISRSLTGRGWTINPGSTVGVIRLPSGLQIEIRPKVPMRNLLWMLATVEELRGIDFQRLEDVVDLDEFDQILEIIAEAFAGMVERRLDLGLYRNYVEEEENLPAVRGRILVTQDVHRNAVLRHRTFCRYTTYSWDLPENQVIRQVARLLAGWGFSPRLTGRFVALDHQMDEVSPSRLTATDVSRFTYNRQSQDYQPIHRYCRFFLDGASLNEEAGEEEFDGFLWDMNSLFEAFVAATLAQRFGPPLRLSDQVRTHLDDARTVSIRPDLVLSRGGLNVLVGDTKYKRLDDAEQKHADLYQMLAYCTALGVDTGVLIYPRHNADIATSIAVRNSPMRLREATIDLRGSIPQIEHELDTLAARLSGWSVPAIAG
jgi:5-methylcytosine-specific restriction enzyme subunit McrC